MKPFNTTIKATTQWQSLTCRDKRRHDGPPSRRSRGFDDACNVVIQLTKKKNPQDIKKQQDIICHAALLRSQRRRYRNSEEVISQPTAKDDDPNEGIKGNESHFSALPSFRDDDDARSLWLSHSCCCDSL